MDSLIILAAGLVCLPLSLVGIHVGSEIANAFLEHRLPWR